MDDDKRTEILQQALDHIERLAELRPPAPLDSDHDDALVRWERGMPREPKRKAAEVASTPAIDPADVAELAKAVTIVADDTAAEFARLHGLIAKLTKQIETLERKPVEDVGSMQRNIARLDEIADKLSRSMRDFSARQRRSALDSLPLPVPNLN